MATLIAAVAVRLHRIRVWLFPNYLPKIKGKFILRTETDDVLDIEHISASAVKMAGGKLDYETMVTYAKHFIDETMHVMCDGFGANLHYFSMHPGVSCTVDSEHEEIKTGDRRIVLRFRERQPARDMLKTVSIDIVGIAESGAYIDEFIDVETGAVNEKATPGGQFIIRGGKDKIEGEPEEVGLYFKTRIVPTISIKMTKHLAKNDPSELIGTIPDLPAGKTWEIEIRTRYTRGGIPLKEVRVIKAGFTVAT